MSVFAQIAAISAPVLTQTFGDSITLIPAGGGANVTLSAMVLDSPPDKTGATPRGQTKSSGVRILKSDYPTKPTLGGTKLLRSNWAVPKTVQKIENENDPIFWNLTVE